MASKVRDRLKELEVFLENARAVENVDETVEHLERDLAEAMVRSRAEAQQCTILLFQSTDPPSLLAFLDASARLNEDARKREIGQARDKVLQLLRAFVETYSKHAAVNRKQIAALVRRTQAIARADPSNKVKSAALLVVISALKHAGALVTADDMEPASYADKLFYDLKFSKATQTAKGMMLEVLGHLVFRFPQECEPLASTLLVWIEDGLERQFSSANPETLLVKGLLFALARLVTFDPDRYKQDETKRRRIYGYLSTVMATTMEGNLTRYNVTKSALLFLTDHCGSFQEEIGVNGYTWFTYMKYCCISENKSIKEGGAINCADAVFHVLGTYLVEKIEPDRKKTTTKILKDTLPILNDSDADNSVLGFALLCLGRLVRAIQSHLGVNAKLKIEEKLRKFGDNILALNKKSTAMRWLLASNFIRCLGYFIQETDSVVDDEYVAFIGDLVCHIMNAYPQCLWKSKFMVHKNILLVFRAIMKCSPTHSLIERFISHTLLLTISNITHVEDAVVLYHPETGNIETKLLYEYENFWVAMLAGSWIPNISRTKTSEQVKSLADNDKASSLRATLFDCMMENIIQVIERLDLAYQYELESDIFGQDSVGYRPNNARDHSILLNLTEFFERVIPRLPKTYLTPWIPVFLTRIAYWSDRLPLVSSFYHIGKIVAAVADELGYFKNSLIDECVSDSIFAKEDYADFVHRTCNQLQLYKDELLVACAGFVLSTPLMLIKIEWTIPALVAALSIGKSYLPAADIAVTALERWQSANIRGLNAVLDQVTPYLGPYLDQADADNKDTALTKAVTEDSTLVEARDISEFAAVQRRIILFLGRIGGQAAFLISKSISAGTDTTCMNVTQTQLLRMPMNLSDLPVELPLDPLIVHLGTLAAQSTDRQIKAAASESYHALICYLCGRTATNPHTNGTKSAYHVIWKRELPSVIMLATDPERICRGLFEPLLFQLARWFCKNADAYPYEYSLFLDQLVTSLSDTGSAKRDLSGKCLSIFLVSSLEKQDHFVNADGIFERLFSLCHHPGNFQRAGAAATMCHFLRSLRSDDSAVIASYALRCIKNLLYSLRLCHLDEEKSGGAAKIGKDMILKAIAKLQRAILRAPHLFSSKKKAPNSQDLTLEAFTRWLFFQVASTARIYREACRSLFITFSAIVNENSCKQWLLTALNEDQSLDVSNVLAPIKSLARVFVSSDLDSERYEEFIDWAEQVCASLECYSWCSEILGEESKHVLLKTVTITAKRKAKPSNIGDDFIGTHTISWAVMNFLKLEYPRHLFGSGGDECMRRKEVTKSYFSVLSCLSRIIEKALSAKNRLMMELVNVNDQVVVDAFSNRLVDFLMDPNANELRVNPSVLEDVQRFCTYVIENNVALVEALTTHAKAKFHALSSSGDSIWKSSHVLPIVMFFNKIRFNILDETSSQHYGDVCALFARNLIKQESKSPQARQMAVQALKAACICGWDITSIFEDDDARRVFACIYTDIISFLPSICVWKQCSSSLLSKSTANVQVLTVLVSALRQVAALRVLKPESDQWDELVKTMLPSFKQIIQSVSVYKSSTQRQRLIVDLLRQMVYIFSRCTEGLIDMLHLGPLPDVQGVLLEMLKYRGMSYLVKAEILDVLAMLGPRSVSMAHQENESKPILEALQAFLIEEFPITSTDVNPGTKDFAVFRLLFCKLLAVIECSHSILYLQILYPCLKEGESHVFVREIKLTLSMFAEEILRDCKRHDAESTPQKGILVLMELADIVLDVSVNVATRTLLLEYVFTPLIEQLEYSNVKSLYLSPFQSDKATLIGKLAAIISSSGDVVSSASIFTCGVAFSLVEKAFRLIDPEFIRTDINNAYLGHQNGKGREFTMLICKCASKVVTKAYDQVDDGIRFACCEAYNCLLIAVARTQKQEKFFDQILFQESIWTNLVDSSTQFNLQAETKLFQKVPLSSLSITTLESRQGRHDPLTNQAGSFALDFFTGSSLSQQETYMVNTSTSSVCAEQAAYESLFANKEIELDSINEHKCMIPLLRVLLQIEADFSSGWSKTDMPGWMKKVFNVVTNSSTDLNIRLFLVRVVLNLPNIFHPYGTQWIPQVMDTLLEENAASTRLNSEFHYLVRDCCHLLLGIWSDVPADQMKLPASRFLNKLIGLSPHNNKAIMQDNILLVHQLILLWTEKVQVDVDLLKNLLYSNPDSPRMEESERFVGLQIISTMLSVGLTSNIVSYRYSADDRTLANGVLDCLKHKKGYVYEVAAEVGGLYLRSLVSEENNFREKIASIIFDAYNDEDFAKFLTLLRNVSAHYPDFVNDDILHRVAYVLPKVIVMDKWSLLAVEILNFATENSEISHQLFTHVLPTLERLLSHRHVGVQYVVLQMLSKLIGFLDQAQMSRLCKRPSNEAFGFLDIFVSHDDSNCRKIFYQIAALIYRNDANSQTKDAVRCALLHGFSDSDSKVRDEVFGFWSDSKLLLSGCRSRLVDLFESFYTPEVAEKWLLYSTNMIIGMAREDNSFDSPLFENPLCDEIFVEATIDSTWQGTNQSMTPMFSIEAEKFNDIAAERLSSLEGDSLYSFSYRPDSSFLQSQLVSSTLQLQNANELNNMSSQGNDGNQKLKRGRRFMKRTSDVGGTKNLSKIRGKSDKNYFQEQHALLKKNQEAILHRQRRARKEQVSMRRKYRAGEVPDIQIKLRDIIEPLILLCQCHTPTSSLVFSVVFPSIVESKTFGDNTTSSTKSLGEHIEHSLALSKNSPTFVDGIHRALYGSVTRNPRLINRVRVSPKTIGDSSLSSGCFHSGELLLEEILNIGMETVTSKQTPPDDFTIECWDQLSKILASVQKNDFLTALSVSCCTIEESRAAVEFQLSGDLPAAISSYKRAQDILETQLELDGNDECLAARYEAHRCFWQRMNCLERLNHWEKLQEELVTEENERDNFIWKQESPYLEQGFGHCARSYIGLIEKKMLANEDSSAYVDELHQLTSSATNNAVTWQSIKAKFSAELSMGALIEENLNQARFLIEDFYADFCVRWRNTSRLAKITRLELMQSLSTAVELDEMLALLRTNSSDRSNAEQESSYVDFINKWTATTPLEGKGGPNIWSQFAMVQKVVGMELLKKGRDDGFLSDTSKNIFLQDLSQVMLKYAKAAVSSDLLALASKYLKDYRELCNEHSLPKVSILMIEVFVSHVLKLVERQEQNSGFSSKRTDSISVLTRYYQTSTRMFDNDDILELMESLPAEDKVTLGCLEAQTFAKAADFYMAAQLDKSQTEEYFSRALDVFQRSCKIPCTRGDSTQSLVQCRLALVEFLTDLVSGDKKNEWEKLMKREDIVMMMAENVLGGMASCDQECSNYFPQLCELIAPYPKVVARFEEYLFSNVPTWTCLRWSAQLLALVNGPLSSTIISILERIAEKYPAALFYDLKVTLATSARTKSKLSRVEALVSSPVMEKFVDALRLIHHPELRLKEGLREVAKLIQDGDTTHANERAAEVWNDCFILDRASLGGQIGRYNRDWARKTKKDLERIMGKNGSNVTAKTIAAAREWISNHFSVTPGKYGISKDMNARLGDFAEWLEEFDHSKFRLELPGQYSTYWGKPNPSSHVSILSFHSILGVLASKQLPKRITLRCSDEQDYTFLVKGGEDLRLDQRIEQLFDQMNHILNAHPRCQDRNLSTRTYKVIPMTQEIGIIEWLNNTATLKGVIESQLQKDDRCADLSSNKHQKLQLFTTTAAKMYEAFLMKQRGASFGAKVAAPSTNDVVKNFKQVQDLIPGDLLRRQLIGSGSDFEAFLVVRDHFVTSLAVFSACSYVLGIGDRHLDNFLLDQKTGKVIGIDFGVSFGAGASILPVPELIPFRFTRQMEYVCHPYDGSNLLVQDMQLVFDALRQKKQVITSVMNVFLHEPLLDWQQSTTMHTKEILMDSANDQATLENTDVEMASASMEETKSSGKRPARSKKGKELSPQVTATPAWLPDVKIAIARRKLDGFSPRLLLKEELAQNVHIASQLTKFQSLIEEAGATTHVAQVQQSSAMSSVAQAQELLALAQSENLLGRTYHGWMPWL